ncbi:MAG: Argininosuccinate lyase C-terminal, partial [Pseudonocardiales bacterium]|nr:Argininosuccinate lyase C-terminal [Pseudonocardiales bacterium]
ARMRSAAKAGFSTATDLADWLVREAGLVRGVHARRDSHARCATSKQMRDSHTRGATSKQVRGVRAWCATSEHDARPAQAPLRPRCWRLR